MSKATPISADMIELAEGIIKRHLQEQCARLVKAGFKDACIYGNYGSDTDTPIWCNVNMRGLGPRWATNKWSLAQLSDAVTEAIAGVPLKVRREALQMDLTNAFYQADAERLDFLEGVLKELKASKP